MNNFNYIKLKIDGKNILNEKYLSYEERKALDKGDAIYIYRSSSKGKFYVGQTVRFINRHKQHYNGNEEKFNKNNFDEVVVFYSKYFNLSSLNDVEAQLINYLFSDTDKKDKVAYEEDAVTNLTLGNHVNDYKDKEEVSNIIIEIWGKVLFEELHWVNTPVLEQLRNNALFKYSPIRSLTDQQSQIISEILNNSKESFVINGDAGTGKTVLLTHIAASLLDQTNKKIAVVVQPNWEKTAKKIFKVYDFNNKNLTITTATSLLNKFKDKNSINENDKYDVVIIDESHKLSRYHTKQHPSFNKVYENLFENCDNHLECIKLISKQLILMYDVFQAIRPANITRQQFENLTKEFNKKKLNTQFRIDVSKSKEYTSDDYINGIKYLLYKDSKLKDKVTSKFNRNIFKDSSVDAYFGYFEEKPLKNMIEWLNRDQNFNPTHINRVLAGLFEKWKQEDGKHPEIKHFIEGDIERRWNSTQKNWINSKDEDASEQIGSVFAVQGIDLNKVGVLLGKDLQVDSQGHLYADKNHFHNVNGKYNKDEENEFTASEFTLHVLNIYYVLLTRGIDGIRIGFWHNEALKDYVKQTLEIK